MVYELNLDPVSEAALPDLSHLKSLVHKTIDEIPSWSKGKVFYDHVQMMSHDVPSGGPAWHARISHHKNAKFDEVWAVLGNEHYQQESNYVVPLKKVELLKTVDIGEAWALHYAFSPPVSPRVFTQILVVWVETGEDGKREGYTLQMPFAIDESDSDMKKKQGKAILGKYVSVETIKETADGVEGTMATRSTPGGKIPEWVVEKTMPGELAKDVPGLLKYLQKQKQQK